MHAVVPDGPGGIKDLTHTQFNPFIPRDLIVKCCRKPLKCIFVNNKKKSVDCDD